MEYKGRKNSRIKGQRNPFIKNLLVIPLVLIMAFLSVGCDTSDIASVFAKEEQVNTKEELRTRIVQGMEQGLTEISFKTSELDKGDFVNLNAVHDGFYGTITSYSMSGFEIFDVSQVTLYCEINDNYYVERAILYGEDIPKSRKSARKLYKTCLKLIPKITKDGASRYRREKRIHDMLVHNVALVIAKGTRMRPPGPILPMVLLWTKRPSATAMPRP